MWPVSYKHISENQGKKKGTSFLEFLQGSIKSKNHSAVSSDEQSRLVAGAIHSNKA